MKYFASVVLLLVHACIGNCADAYIPPYIVACDYANPSFEKCVKDQIEISLPLFTKGIPELKVPAIDPIQLDDIKIDGNGLKLHFNEAALHGLSQSKVTDLKINVPEEKFVLAFKGNMFLTAKYVIEGNILILPIRGKGDAKVIAENLDVMISSKMTHFNDSKGEHLKLVTPSYNYKIGRTKFDFQNLFSGNKQLAETTHAFANNNWEQIMDDLAPPVVKQIVRTAIKSINKFFAAVTIQQIIKGYHY